MTRPSLYARLGVPPTFDEPHKWVTSPVIRSPILLATIRLTFALFALATILITLINRVQRGSGQSYFSLFTYLTLIGLCAYFFAAGVQTTSYAIAWRRKGAGAGYALQRWPKVLQALHVVLHSTIVSFPILVTITFWAIIAGPDTLDTPFSRFSNISTHVLNTVLALFEIFLTNTPPPPWLALPCCILFLGGYLGVAYITHATQGFYPYNFLDPSKNGVGVVGWIFGVLIAAVLIFCIVKCIMHFRQRWVERTGRIMQVQRGIESGSDIDEDEWEQVVRPGPTSPGGAGGSTADIQPPSPVVLKDSGSEKLDHNMPGVAI